MEVYYITVLETKSPKSVRQHGCFLPRSYRQRSTPGFCPWLVNGCLHIEKVFLLCLHVYPFICYKTRDAVFIFFFSLGMSKATTSGLLMFVSWHFRVCHRVMAAASPLCPLSASQCLPFSPHSLPKPAPGCFYLIPSPRVSSPPSIYWFSIAI